MLYRKCCFILAHVQTISNPTQSVAIVFSKCFTASFSKKCRLTSNISPRHLKEGSSSPQWTLWSRRSNVKVSLLITPLLPNLSNPKNPPKEKETKGKGTGIQIYLNDFPRRQKTNKTFKTQAHLDLNFWQRPAIIHFHHELPERHQAVEEPMLATSLQDDMVLRAFARPAWPKQPNGSNEVKGPNNQSALALCMII